MDDIVSELGPLRMASLRGSPADRAFISAMSRALGADLPVEVGRAYHAGGLWTLCLGPSEWLVMGGRDEGGDPAALLKEAVGAPARVAVVDVSAAYVGFSLRGPKADRLLSKGCALDLHPTALARHRCARTLLARVPVILLRRDADDEIWLLTGASYAQWLSEWFADAQLS